MNRRGFLNRAAAFLATMLMPWRKPLTDADADIVVWYDADGQRYSWSFAGSFPAGYDWRNFVEKHAKNFAKKIEWADSGTLSSKELVRDTGRRVCEIHLGRCTDDLRDYRFIRSFPVDWARPWEKGPCTLREAMRS